MIPFTLTFEPCLRCNLTAFEKTPRAKKHVTSFATQEGPVCRACWEFILLDPLVNSMIDDLTWDEKEVSEYMIKELVK